MQPLSRLSPIIVCRQLTRNLIAVTKSDGDIKTFFTVLSQTQELPKEDLAPDTFAKQRVFFNTIKSDTDS